MKSLEQHINEAESKIAAAMERHSRAVLAFSGGKDSLACLRLLYPYRERVTVATVDTGAMYPHMVEFIKQATQDFQLVTIRTDQAAYWNKHGVPSRIVSLYNHPAVGFLEHAHGERFLVNDWLSCHAALVNQPMHDFVQSSGASLVVMGQRDDEGRAKLPPTAGVAELLTPIESWTAPTVFDYLRSIGVAPPAHYSELPTSLDCWNCPSHTTEKTIRFLKREHPERVDELRAILHVAYSTVVDALHKELPTLQEAGLLDTLAVRLECGANDQAIAAAAGVLQA